MKIVHHIAWVTLSILISQSSSAATLTQPPAKTISAQMANLKTKLRKQLQKIKECLQQKKCSRTLISATVATISALLVLFAGLGYMTLRTKEKRATRELYENLKQRKQEELAAIKKNNQKLTQHENELSERIQTELHTLNQVISQIQTLEQIDSLTQTKLDVLLQKQLLYEQTINALEQASSIQERIELLEQLLKVLKPVIQQEQTENPTPSATSELEEIENDDEEE